MMWLLFTWTVNISQGEDVDAGRASMSHLGASRLLLMLQLSIPDPQERY